jgi:hypothetical protein
MVGIPTKNMILAAAAALGLAIAVVAFAANAASTIAGCTGHTDTAEPGSYSQLAEF